MNIVMSILILSDRDVLLKKEIIENKYLNNKYRKYTQARFDGIKKNIILYN